MRTQLPPENGWGIWIGHYERKHWPSHWVAIPFLLLPEKIAAKRSTRRATYYNSQATTQIIGQLLIHVMRSPMHSLIPRWIFKLPRGIRLYRIWPPSNYSFVWPSGTLDDTAADDASNAARAFLKRVEADRLASGGLPVMV